MKKITLILAMMMVVLSGMAKQDGPSFSFMKGGRGKSRTDMVGGFGSNQSSDIKYNSNTAETAAMDFDAVNNTPTQVKSIFRYNLGNPSSAGQIVGGDMASSAGGVTVGDSHTITGKGTAINATLKEAKVTHKVTLGFAGHTALFGDELQINEDGDSKENEFETPRVPLGNAHAPLLMAVLAMAWFLIRRKH